MTSPGEREGGGNANWWQKVTKGRSASEKSDIITHTKISWVFKLSQWAGC